MCQQRLHVLQKNLNIFLIIIIKSLCKQRLLVCLKKSKFVSYYYHSYSSRQNLVRTSSPAVLMIQICSLAHIFI